MVTLSCGLTLAPAAGPCGSSTVTGWRWCRVREVMFLALCFFLGVAVHRTAYYFWAAVRDAWKERKQ